MSPKVVGTTSFGLQSMPTNGFLRTSANLAPETEAWVKWRKEETYYAVGQLAEQLYAPEGLKILKWQRAIPKLLAALWVIQQRHRQQLSRIRKLNVSLACLLPPGEYESRHLLHQAIEQIDSFETPTGMVQVGLKQFECYPECAGVLGLFQQQVTSASKTLAFIMMGYRNASLLVVRHGKLSMMLSSDLGFVRCTERVQEHSCGLEISALLPAMAEAAKTRNAVPYLNIVPYLEPPLKEQNARQLVELVEQAKTAYFHQLSQWLDEYIPLTEQPSLVFCGGTAETMQAQLNQYQPHLPHYYSSNLALADELERISTKNRARILDVCGTFEIQFARSVLAS
ncbi:hypothetical protein H6G20_06135 [Desertifilum sp. FACHB-1129]|uniref:hypothetical protein n=1 Tax=unclassified Desertifilum TaxID=2621682 RepID=UPI001684E56B|nr:MULTISPECIES: hypothetical protein [unclassified Desertifilum]MBD2311236.1 hypothetical protein [Desertifilum sp. FACHB-1129]MBD2324319.1 hypothetical protein [Desertifilum sp. FACHB-866]MBD2334333.1 hypothetical protein [Desertifilum sp. FACHB-868]MDA0213179.1 hypothetical protein [Cyanobacteria bacterium FC1]